ncbi:MAG: SIS domain-containing protein [Bacteroidota bacterium]
METVEFVSSYAAGFHKAVDAIEATDGSGKQVGFTPGVASAVEILLQLQAESHRIYIVGNGGSAAIASHAAIDFWKNGGIPAHTFNDSSLLTCIANDIGFEDVFAKPLEMFATEGDLVICISSSGNSPDIIKACQAAEARKCRIITLSGFSPDNRLRALGHLNFFVPGFSYGFVEILHQYVLHCILDAKMYTRDGKDVFNKNLNM